jgi:hypothetical protein
MKKKYLALTLLAFISISLLPVYSAEVLPQSWLLQQEMMPNQSLNQLNHQNFLLVDTQNHPQPTSEEAAKKQSLQRSQTSVIENPTGQK